MAKMPAIQALPSGKFRIQVRRKGEQADELFDTLKAAESYREARWGVGGTSDKMKLAGFYELVFKRSPRYTGATPNTRATYDARFQHLRRHLGETSLADITPAIVMDYCDARAGEVAARTKRTPAADTIRLEVGVLSSVLALAVKRKLIQHNPALEAERPAPQKRTRRVAPDERVRMLEGARDQSIPAHLRAAARFVLAQTEIGCRVSELAGLRCADVDLTERRVLARGVKEKGDAVKYLSPLAARLIREQIAEHPGQVFVWQSQRRTGEPAPYGYKYRIEQLKAAGIVLRDYHTHASRREYTSDGIEKGIPYDDIRVNTGHKTLASIERYNAALALPPARTHRLDEFFGARTADLKATATAELVEREAAARAAAVAPSVAELRAQAKALLDAAAALEAGAAPAFDDTADMLSPAPPRAKAPGR